MIDGHLHVADVSVEDTKVAYRCFARHRLNSLQQRPSSSPPAKILFSHQQVNFQQQQQQQPLQHPLPSAPQLVPVGVHPFASPRIRHVRLGQDEVYMTCTVVAYPPPKIRYDNVLSFERNFSPSSSRVCAISCILHLNT